MRLFFAIWPPREVAAALHEWALGAQRAVGGRVTTNAKIHLTLAFLGERTPERAQAATAAAHHVRFAPHCLAIEQAAYRRHNRIVWAGPREVPAALADLAAALRAALAQAGFTLEKRAFAAHVTLLRKARGDVLAPLPAIAWPVTEFVLVHSVLATEGSRYTNLETFRCGHWAHPAHP